MSFTECGTQGACDSVVWLPPAARPRHDTPNPPAGSTSLLRCRNTCHRLCLSASASWLYVSLGVLSFPLVQAALSDLEQSLQQLLTLLNRWAGTCAPPPPSPRPGRESLPLLMDSFRHFIFLFLLKFSFQLVKVFKETFYKHSLHFILLHIAN